MLLDLAVAIFGALLLAGGARALISAEIPMTKKRKARGLIARILGNVVIILGILALLWSLPVILLSFA